jgi:hypothetical protein
MEIRGTMQPKKAHIDNHSLFNLASGRFSLPDWEHDHLHACEICQGVLYILLNQLTEGASEPNPKSADDAA